MSRVKQEAEACLEDLGELQRECEDYAAVARAERETRARLFEQVRPLLAQLRHPVNLDLEMGGVFPRAVKLTVGDDLSLKVTHARERTDSEPSLSLEDAFVKVMTLVAAKLEEEADRRKRREVSKSKPRLRAELKLSKGRLPIFGRWRYNLVVFNLGGDALSVALTTRCGGKERLFDGFDIPKGRSVSCELQDSSGELRSDRIGVDLLCSDAKGLPYLGTVKLPGRGGRGTIRLKDYGSGVVQGGATGDPATKGSRHEVEDS